MPKTLKCCVQGCKESSRNVIEELSFHRIPRDEATRNIWCSIIQANTNHSTVFPIQAIVCSKHFPDNSFIDRVNGSRFLKKNSLPSIFPNPQRESSKTIWSDDEGDDKDFRSDPLDDPQLIEGVDEGNEYASVSVKEEIVEDLVHCIDWKNFRENCRLCLTSPKFTEIEKLVPIQDIAELYKSLTNIELNYTDDPPDIICTTCTSKLKNAIEFREMLIEANSRWDMLLVKESNEITNITEEHLLDYSSSAKSFLNEPKLHNEVVLAEDSKKHSKFGEHVNNEFFDDANDLPVSDDDSKFSDTIDNFIKSVQPTKTIETSMKANQKFVKMKNTIPVSERLNFRSSSSPHSSQKLKKHNNWFRLMHDCNYCDAKDFLSVIDLNKHLKNEHPERIKVTCDICKKDYSEMIYLRKHMKYVHQTKQHKCEYCGKRFYYHYNLKSHMLVHTGNERNAICHLCGKFFTSTALRSHLRSGVHADSSQISRNPSSTKSVQRYYCHICVPAQRFDLCSELTEHRRLMHKDFECSICRGWFSCMEALENHIKTHSSKERKFSCKICANTFVRSSHLEGHIRRKHATVPKPIACDLCDYRCVEPYELTGHKKHQHSKLRAHKCVYCVRTFTHAQALKDHILIIHKIGEFRYSCSYCPRRFTNSASLINHRGVHHNGAGN